MLLSHLMISKNSMIVLKLKNPSVLKKKRLSASKMKRTPKLRVKRRKPRKRPRKRRVKAAATKMKRPQLLRLDLLKLFKNSTSSMKTLTTSGQIVMRKTTPFNNLMPK